MIKKCFIITMLLLVVSTYANATLLWESDKGQLIYQNPFFGASDSVNKSIGFDFSFYGETFSSLWINSTGTISFNDMNESPGNIHLPAVQPEISPGVPVPNKSMKMLAPLWDYLIAKNEVNGIEDPEAGVWVNSLGTPGSKKLVITWNSVSHFNEMSNPTPFYGSDTFQVILFEGTTDIVFSYLNLDGLTDPAHTGGYTFGESFFPNNTNGVTIGVNGGDFAGSQYIRGNEYLYGFPESSLLPANDSILLTYSENYYAPGVGEYLFSTFEGPSTSPIPEPSTIFLTGTALLTVFFIRCKNLR